jgi:hypothetical protein
MYSFFCLTLFAALSATSCLAQTGTVIFYTPGISVKSEAAVFLPKSQQPFSGWLSNGPQRLAHFRPGRFAIFHMNPGAYSFTVLDTPGPARGALVINVKDGSRHCVRLFARMINVGVYAQWDNQIEEVPCERAEREAAHLKPIGIKRVDPAARADLDSTTTFPSEIRPLP